jgi:sortase (surface protein transpeptidase)
MTQDSRRRRVTLAASAAVFTAALAGGAVALVTSGPASVPMPSESHPATSPVTVVNPRLVDRQRPPGKESTILAGPASRGNQPATDNGPALVIPELGVDAPIVSEGIDTTPGDAGNLAIPADVGEVGWWYGGPAPGQPGTAVLASHRAEDGVFWNLPDLRPGDTIEVRGTNGRTTSWQVSQVQQLLKADLPASVWAEGGPPRLVLVTCGGVFNYSTGHYNDNVIVWATPA